MIMAIAGHVSPKMLDHYSHVRMQAKRQALNALSEKASAKGEEGESAEGYGTKNVTNSKPERVPSSQVVEKNGGDDETRTRDLCRDSPVNRDVGKGVGKQPLFLVGQKRTGKDSTGHQRTRKLTQKVAQFCGVDLRFWLPKLRTWVRFPSPAQPMIRLPLCG